MRDLLAGVIGLVLVVAGTQKLLAGHDAFRAIVRGYNLVGLKASAAIARILPVLEIGVGAGLFVLVQVTTLAWIAAALFASFAIAISVNLVRGRSEIPCGCFGQSGETIGAGALLRALVLLVAAVTIQLADAPLDLGVSRVAYVGLVWIIAATAVLLFGLVVASARMERLGQELRPVVEAMHREDSRFDSRGDG